MGLSSMRVVSGAIGIRAKGMVGIDWPGSGIAGSQTPSSGRRQFHLGHARMRLTVSWVCWTSTRHDLTGGGELALDVDREVDDSPLKEMGLKLPRNKEVWVPIEEFKISGD